MNKLNLILLSFIFTFLFGCVASEKADDTPSIIGQWQNLHNPDMGLEFDAEGNYYLLKSKERLSIENEAILQYAYNPENEENNFVLKEQLTDITYSGKLTFLNKDTVILSLHTSISDNFKVELSRMNNH